ncbi:MAG: pantoate--beta-alanine ligase [Gemmatimonadaceae bacterium]
MSSTATNMRTATAIAEIRAAVAEARQSGARIGFVPTMGALHQGHLSLVERSRRESDVTVMSIFVNPLQFAPGEDYSRYPRPVDQDDNLARDAGVDILFRPTAEDMYPGNRTITVTAGVLGADWEGASRPGHFDGVLTVVAKLLNIVLPDIAVFGRKDLQQAALVEALVRDLDMPVSIVLTPTIREPDGIAMSSRNRYLDSTERLHARSLSQALEASRSAYSAGERGVAALEAAGRSVLDSEPGVKPDYFAIIDPSTFTRRATADASSAAIVAARVGSTRLIDNISLVPDGQD